MFFPTRHGRIEGFHAKSNNTSEEVVGKCRKCGAEALSK
jgi:hypothetical protein